MDMRGSMFLKALAIDDVSRPSCASNTALSGSALWCRRTLS
ncbi:MAG: hypothetical protein QS748_07540 [Candidatus Endonucleobacter bathymodioli]|uniref:Uncharacterized protein n=1 Tax=Candidatus Endonucleibacter bathymodioli TaxID=539814 RepID=A0AA90NTV3_9GAMM|nr:hypothetical protein [Candidatus Endonucleobacter bathymodioli]